MSKKNREIKIKELLETGLFQRHERIQSECDVVLIGTEFILCVAHKTWYLRQEDEDEELSTYDVKYSLSEVIEMIDSEISMKLFFHLNDLVNYET